MNDDINFTGRVAVTKASSRTVPSKRRFEPWKTRETIFTMFIGDDGEIYYHEGYVQNVPALAFREAGRGSRWTIEGKLRKRVRRGGDLVTYITIDRFERVK